MNEAQLRIEVKDNPDRNRFWEALKRLEENTGTKLEQKHDRRFVDRYFDCIRKYEDAAILSWSFTIGGAYRRVHRLLFRAADRLASTPVTCVSRCLSCYAKFAVKKMS